MVTKVLSVQKARKEIPALKAQSVQQVHKAQQERRELPVPVLIIKARLMSSPIFPPLPQQDSPISSLTKRRSTLTVPAVSGKILVLSQAHKVFRAFKVHRVSRVSKGWPAFRAREGFKEFKAQPERPEQRVRRVLMVPKALKVPSVRLVPRALLELLELVVLLVRKAFKVWLVLPVPQVRRVQLERRVPQAQLELLELQVPPVQMELMELQAHRVQQVLPGRLEPQAPLVQMALTVLQAHKVPKVIKVWPVHKAVLVLASYSRVRLLLQPLCQLRPLKVSPTSLTAPARCGFTTLLTPGLTAVPFKVPKVFKVSRVQRAQ
jgi:hypothetical protein